ncbi:methyl-accepting chemotaxis protein [Paraburkholderia acidisoli]|uniref:HAMP domain-containing protein n=1 Tax=Paraburkholderia acidisoli TaxID=2571748 RepID=A0A7Z2GRW0_9BURK|nr:methyl-accepting chemotaxis protein [Paraburkholderia acidisoli]QGZ66827.1 HAMP domain-containing protein [Paraburkholderia acidisoli]
MSRTESLKTRLYALIALIALAFVVSSVWAAWQMRSALVASHAVELEHLTGSLRSMMLAEQAQAAANGLSDAQAQANVLKQIHSMRYGEDGYFFVVSDDTVLLTHANESLIGKNVGDFKSADGKFIYRDLVSLGQRNGKGEYDYDFPRPGATVAEHKLAYYVYDPKWHWLIATGVYIADVDAAFHLALEKQMALTVLIIVALLILIQVGTQRMMLTPIANAMTACEAIAAGDLTRDVPTAAPGEIGLLMRALRTMQERLAATVAEIGTSSHAVSSAAHQVTAGSTDLSSRTEEQAASLEQTAASMEELTVTVRQNAESARHASSLADDASAVASEGDGIVGRVVETMTDIRDSSHKIAEIIGIIEGIAFQTNILALNAAVEAARAGEHGRGFAVVASEVRGLAQRSSTAAREIKVLIETSGERVLAGTALASEAGATMHKVGVAIQRVTQVMSEIASASNEQSRGIDQINQAVSQMDAITQQNAALVEQASAAASMLQDQAEHLRAAVSVFRTRDTAGA